MNPKTEHNYPAILADERLTGDAHQALRNATEALAGAFDQRPIDPANLSASAADLVALPADPDLIRAARDGGFDRAILAIAAPPHTQPSPGWAAAAIEAGADDAADHASLDRAGPRETIEKTLTVASIRRRRDARAASTIAAAETRAADLAERVAALESQAWTDPLTGLANRRQLAARLDRMFAEAVRYESDLACAMLDLDGFKALNDKLGHREGDACLQQAARAVAESVRASDVAARYGGDEFVILMPQTTIAEAATVARRAAEAFHKHVAHWCGCCDALGLSVGVSSVNASKPLDAEGLVDAADRAMYASKAQGTGAVMICNERGAPTDAAKA